MAVEEEKDALLLMSCRKREEEDGRDYARVISKTKALGAQSKAIM